MELKPYYENEFGQLYHGDCRDVLNNFDKRVDCCVTSPPYFGLRDYGEMNQIGLEPTPEEYTSVLTCICDGIFKSLKPSGTFWLNLGDSYATSNPVGRRDTGEKYLRAGRTEPEGSFTKNSRKNTGLKAKQLIGIPWRVALSLQSSGWFLRQDIIWNKTNPMPESCKDRCTRSHEYIFLLSKKSKYYFDHLSIREESAESSKKRGHIKRKPSPKHLATDPKENRAANMDKGNYGQGRNKRTVWSTSLKPFKEAHFAVFPSDLIQPCILAGCPEGGVVLDPFFGAGTTGIVAQMSGRKWVGIELSEKYCEIAAKRIEKETQQMTLF